MSVGLNGKNLENINSPTIDEYMAEIECTGRMMAIVRQAFEKARNIRNEFSVVYYIAGGLTGVADSVKARCGLLGRLIAQQESSFGMCRISTGPTPSNIRM